jgi:uncharacterized protein YciI
MKYVLIYEPGGPDMAAQARLHFAEHRAKWDGYRQEGTLLLIGPFADGSGAMAVFTTREAAEQFAKEDPFVVNGVVGGWSVREWHEALFETGV